MLYGARSTRGVLQDRYLSVAARLAEVSIDEHFNESSHKPGTYGRLTSWQMKRQQSLNGQAISEVAASSTLRDLSDLDAASPVSTAFCGFITSLLAPSIEEASVQQACRSTSCRVLINEVAGTGPQLSLPMHIQPSGV